MVLHDDKWKRRAKALHSKKHGNSRQENVHDRHNTRSSKYSPKLGDHGEVRGDGDTELEVDAPGLLSNTEDKDEDKGSLQLALTPSNIEVRGDIQPSWRFDRRNVSNNAWRYEEDPANLSTVGDEDDQFDCSYRRIVAQPFESTEEAISTDTVHYERGGHLHGISDISAFGLQRERIDREMALTQLKLRFSAKRPNCIVANTVSNEDEFFETTDVRESTTGSTHLEVIRVAQRKSEDQSSTISSHNYRSESDLGLEDYLDNLLR